MAKNCKPSIIIPDKYSVVVVQNITERNDISCKLRQNGMIAIVVEEGYAQYQIQTQQGFYGVCDNNAWVQIETGTKIFDGSNLVIINDEEHKQEYLQSPLIKVGQMVFYVPENKYYRYDGYDFVDPFSNKLEKPTQFTNDPDEHYIPVYDNELGNPEWLPSNTLGKVESVNNITPTPGSKNIELTLSNFVDDVGYATDIELTQLAETLDTRIVKVEGINYIWNPTNRSLTLFDASGRQMSQVSLVSLDNEGTDIRYNASTLSLDLYNADNELLDSIPVSSFIGSVGTRLQLNSNELQLKDSQGNVLSTVSFAVSNIQGLQTALEGKLDKGGYSGTAQDLKNSIETKQNKLSSFDESILIETDGNIEGNVSLFTEYFNQQVCELNFTPIQIIGVYQDGIKLLPEEFNITLPKTITITTYSTEKIEIQYTHLKNN